MIYETDFLKAKKAYFDKADSLLKRGLTYDPNQRRFVEYLAGIDGGIDKTKKHHLWFQYMPLAAHACAGQDFPSESFLMMPNYRLKVLHPETLRNHSTTTILQDHLIRRYRGLLPDRIGVVLLTLSDRVSHQGEQQGTSAKDMEGGRSLLRLSASSMTSSICLYLPEGNTGLHVNRCLDKAMADKCDLVVIWQPDGNEFAALDLSMDIDMIFPAYPVVLRHGLLLTPIQICQINGCPPGSQCEAIVQNMLARITMVLGAVLVRVMKCLTQLHRFH